MEYRFADGKYERLPELAAELVRLKADVIVTGTSAAIRTLQRATNTIPIVLAYSPDPVGNAFVASLARPGGNITGVVTLSVEVAAKRLEVAHQLVPTATMMALLAVAFRPFRGLSWFSANR